MSKAKGFIAYKKYWEDQASFMDKSPWAKENIFVLTISRNFIINLEELKYSNYCLTKGDKCLTL